MTTLKPPKSKLEDRRSERRRRYIRGRLAEFVAAVWLMGKGYRVLAMREKTPVGEIDIIAYRHNRLAFVEVKFRKRSIDAHSSISATKSRRIRRAAALWVARRPRFQEAEIGLDTIFLTLDSWPEHKKNFL